jgi:hypothetical protein
VAHLASKMGRARKFQPVNPKTLFRPTKLEFTGFLNFKPFGFLISVI